MDRAKIKEKLMEAGFAEVIPPKNGRRYFRAGIYYDLDSDGNPIPEDTTPETEEDPAAIFVDGVETGVVTPEPAIGEIPTKFVRDPVSITSIGSPLDERLYINGKPLEEADKKELYDYVKNFIDDDVHHNTGKNKLIKIIEASKE